MNLNESRGRGEYCLEEMLLLTAQNVPLLDPKENFTIVKELGSGSYGSVLLAVHQTQGTPMALKFMRKSNTEKEAFLLEYCISLSLSGHPCVIGAFGIAFQTASHYVFAQELAMADSLFSIMKPQVGIPEMSVKRCAVQLCSALDFMANKGLVHRDIKPENVLLFDSHCRRIKLTDFGLACPNGTAVKSMPENLPYTAPEMCTLSATDTLVAHASLDVWSFGVLLFCILTGYFPWSLALSSDKHFQAYGRWHRSSRIFKLPLQWQVFSTEALEMFKKLVAPEPTQRSPAKEVMHYLKSPWKVSSLPDNKNSGQGFHGKVDNSQYLQGRAGNKNFLVKKGC
uniref:Serine/threonine-protein kinase SBK1-like n=1 Tax=Geotrypetes seraphini TaxID=260995 RepID=A0A6P8SGW3_GEOSA|nr:serine/threonine-protein kinase SBK1-like [Geotrypetes seraphini]